MAGFDFGYPSDDEIWEKISSDDINSRVEGLLDAGRKVGFVDGNPAQAINYLETARELADSLNDFTGMAHSLHLMGAMHARLKQWEECALVHEAGADAGKRSFRADLEIDHLAYAARAYKKLGDVAAVRRNFELAIAMAGEEGSWRLALLQGEYGRFLRKQGDLVAARKYLESAASSEDLFPSAMASAELVTVLLSAGDAAGALAAAREAHSLASYNDDETMKAKTAYGIAKALVGMENYSGALKELDAIDLNMGSSVKHKVRVDLLRAAAMIGLEAESGAVEILNRAIPLLGKFKLWESLGEALVSKAECSSMLVEQSEALDAAAVAYGKAGNDAEVCACQVRLGILHSVEGDWEQVEHWAGLVTANVLQMFTVNYVWALGLLALAKAKLGKSAEAADLAAQVFASASVPSMVSGYAYHAQALVVGGVKGKNLAVKAMKAYLASSAVALATEVSSLA